ncbi:ciliary neurotrophic factor [Cricetulus griseus]
MFCYILGQVKHQGLNKNINLDSVAGVPVASTDRWSEMTEAERLQENLQAYRTFHGMLTKLLEDQRVHFTPTEGDFHQAIHTLLLQVSAFAYQLEELMVLMEQKIPENEVDGMPVTVGDGGLFEKKLWGLKVLQELSQWTVYGTVYHMNHGNPFNLKALVDKWPEFNTVVVRPQEQDMANDLDHYTNTYQIFSKDPQNCQKFLDSPEVINWKQHLQIQSSQSRLNEVIQNLASIRSSQVNHSENILYVAAETIKNLFPSLLDTKNLLPGGVKPKAM